MTKGKVCISLLVALLLVVASVMACAPAPPAPAPPTPAPPAPEAKVYNLKAQCFVSTKHHLYYRVSEGYFADLEKRTNGQVKTTIYPGGSLVGTKESYDAVVSGIADTALWVAGYAAGRHPVLSVLDLPFLIPHGIIGTNAILMLRPYIEKYDFPDTKFLFWSTVPPYHLLTVKKVESVDDLKGLKIRSTGGYQNRCWEMLGVVPVGLPASEMYPGIQRGTLDGSSMSYASAPGYSLQELITHVIELGITCPQVGYVMNWDTYNGLPKDIQATIDDMVEEWSIKQAESYYIDEDKGKEIFAEAGVEIYIPPKEVMDVFRSQVEPIYDEWIADLEGKGLPGREIFNKVAEFVGAPKR